MKTIEQLIKTHCAGYAAHVKRSLAAALRELQAQHETELATLRARLGEARGLLSSMPSFHSTRPDEIPALSRWVTQVCAFLAAAEAIDAATRAPKKARKR